MDAGVDFCSEDGYCGKASSPEICTVFRNVEGFLGSCPGREVVTYDSRNVRRIEILPGCTGYVKVIYALTDAGLHGRDMGSWLKWVLRPSRALGVWRVSRQLEEAGLRCARPILAARRRNSWGYPTDVIVTEEVPYPELWSHAAKMPLDALIELLVGETRRLHQAGFAHGDYILRNLCYDEKNSRLILLDNDRTWMVPRCLRRHYQNRNLAQLCYSIMRRFENLDSGRNFLDAYADAQDGCLTETEKKNIFAACSKRMRRYLDSASAKREEHE